MQDETNFEIKPLEVFHNNTSEAEREGRNFYTGRRVLYRGEQIGITLSDHTELSPLYKNYVRSINNETS